jgi:hypothetical protein
MIETLLGASRRSADSARRSLPPRNVSDEHGASRSVLVSRLRLVRRRRERALIDPTLAYHRPRLPARAGVNQAGVTASTGLFNEIGAKLTFAQ